MAISSSSRGLRPGVCTSTTRPSNPYDGMVIYETDTDKVAIYDVNAWVYKTGTTAPTAPALVFITGTTFSAVTSFSLPTNTFSSTYLNYKVLVNFTTTQNGHNLTMKLRAGGTDSSENYNGAFFGRTNGAVQIDSAYSSASAANILYSSDTPDFIFGLDMTVFSPQTTTRTGFTYLANSAKSDFGTIGFVSGGGLHLSLTAYDSLTFISSVALKLSGSYKIYGISNS